MRNSYAGKKLIPTFAIEKLADFFSINKKQKSYDCKEQHL